MPAGLIGKNGLDMKLFGEYGPFFEVELHDGPPTAPWRSVADLPHAPEVAERIELVRRTLDGTERVAASVSQLSLIARLIAPALACSVRFGRSIGLAGWYFQAPLTSTFALSIPRDPTPGPILAGPIQGLIDTLGQVPARSALGNVASAVNTATLLIGRSAYPYAERVLASLPGEPGPIGRNFRRGSCCLIYQAGRPYCGDCVLPARA